MTESYFRRVQAQTPTQFFCDIGDMASLRRAVEWGAVGATFNPPRAVRVVRGDPEYWLTEVDRIIHGHPELPDEDLADMLTRAIVGKASQLLRPVFERSGGQKGFQAIQGNPLHYADLDVLTSSARRYRRIAPNVAVKIPMHQEGLVAIEELAAEGIHLIPTTGYSVSQCLAAALAHQRGTKQAQKRGANPERIGRCFVAMVTGRLDVHLKEQIAQAGINLPDGWVDQAGIAVTKKLYRIFRERGLPALLLSAGARGPHHFSEFVGGDMAVTLGPPVQEELIQLDGKVVSRMDDFPPSEVIEELRLKLPDFRRAYDEDGLTASEMRGFGPCVTLEQYFVNGFNDLLQFIRSRKS